MSAAHRRLYVGAILAAVIGLSSLLLPTSPGHDGAWLDRRGTDSSVAAVSDIARAVFTVTPESVAAVRAEARRGLSGRAVTQYRRLYGPVLRSARTQGATLTTDIRAVGVVRLAENNLEMLVIADQTATSGARSQTGAAQLRVSATRGEHGWAITDIAVI